MKKLFYVNGEQIEEGDIISQVGDPINENLGYVRKIFIEDKEIAVNLLSQSKPIILNDEMLKFEKLPNEKGYKIFGFCLLMKEVDWKRILIKLLKKEIKELNYQIEDKYIRQWTQ